MKEKGFFLKYAILLAAQIMLMNFFNFSQYLVLTLLPAMVMFIPVNHGTPYILVVAFVTGFAVDFLSGGVLGLSSAALLSVALLRYGVIRLVFGSEIFLRDENLSFERQGFWKVFAAIFIFTFIFLTLYIWIDAAGSGDFLFHVMKICISTVASSIVSILVADILTSDSHAKWK